MAVSARRFTLVINAVGKIPLKNPLIPRAL